MPAELLVGSGRRCGSFVAGSCLRLRVLRCALGRLRRVGGFASGPSSVNPAPGRQLAIRLASAGDLTAMRAVAAAAGERFRALDEPRIARCADDPPVEVEALAAYSAAGRAWVATEDGAVVGFAIVDLLDGCAHVEEIDVHPVHEGHGHGSALLDAVAAWAGRSGLTGVTLTTFADVPWNRPFYERRGFRVLAGDELTASVIARVADEAAHGLDPELRVVMRLDVPPS